MSDSPSNVTEGSEHQPPASEESPQEPAPPEKRKLSFSQSENKIDSSKNVKHKPLSKVKSWSSSSKDQDSLREGRVSVELDLVRSLTKLEVSDSSEEVRNNLLRARDSLDSLVKDEQNMPKSTLQCSIIHHKPRNMPGSPKSSPQLGENCKASSSKMPYWDLYDRQGKKNRKDIKRRNKVKSVDSPKNDRISTEGHTTQKEQSQENEPSSTEASVLESEESCERYKFLAKNSKSVVFTNEVLVVYFNNDDVVGEEKEPLKKEVEQQTRNKEMRRIHLNKTQEKYNLCLF